MKISPARALILIVFFASSFEQLNFSFRSQYDGYIYPSWKEKLGMKEQLYEDAVVVGRDFIVLADGLGGTKGLSGVFSIHQCLNIAKQLSQCYPTKKEELTRAVFSASDSATSMIDLFAVHGSMYDVATTLVYMKIHNNKLLSGVIGDSGFSIYRYDNTARMLKLVQRSEEKVWDFNSPFAVTRNVKNPQTEYEDDVEEGDVVIAASDGVLDVLPSSFITAATNYLVYRMIEKTENGQSLDDFDYDYDLADFVERYVENLSAVSLELRRFFQEEQLRKKIFPLGNNQPRIDSRLQNKYTDMTTNDPRDSIDHRYVPRYERLDNIFKELDDSKRKNFELDDFRQKNERSKAQYVPKVESRDQDSSVGQDTIDQRQNFKNKLSVSNPFQTKLASKTLSTHVFSNDELEQRVSTEKERPNYKPSQQSTGDKVPEKGTDANQLIDESMREIFKYEICNLFDPTSSSQVFKTMFASEKFANLSLRNIKNKPQQTNKQVDCFQNKEVEKRISHDKYPSTWRCKDIFDLTYPVHPIRGTSGSLHNFRECVERAIPVLPRWVRAADIAKAFNSRYFARNLALAVKYLTNDRRAKLDNFMLKALYDRPAADAESLKQAMADNEEMWRAKEDDVSIAAAAITGEDRFNKAARRADTRLEPKPSVDPPSLPFREDLSVHAYKLEYWLGYRAFAQPKIKII